MRLPYRRSAALVVLAVLEINRGGAQRPATKKWSLQYSYDQSESTLALTAFQFPSAQRGVAAGYVVRNERSTVFGDRKKITPTVLVTADGGTSWTPIEVKAIANALFFVDDSTGWLAADDGLWITMESGRTWKRISSIKSLNDIFFLTPKHGFAVGTEKRFLETQDGGATWKPVAAGATPTTPKDTTQYSALTFNRAGQGVVVGQSYAGASWEREPVWLNPENPGRSRQRDVIFLFTDDGGKNWRVNTQSMYGEPDRVTLAPNGSGFMLFDLPRAAPWPSEVLKLGFAGTADRLYRNRDRAITDILALPGGEAIVAGYELPGHVHPSPIPGKVKIMHTTDFNGWTEVPVDYRAVARNVMLASAGPDNLWAATDTGMILKLQN